ncbi:MAG: hypothetical protein J6I64_08455, partial [Lachnospiraceae bacterium]|nr:hypothetical protein [Lachnospiraceae bacterium]
MYPCNIFPAEPSEEVLVQKIEIEKQWTWEDEKLMAAYTCKKNMDAFRKEHDEKYPMDLHDFQDVAQNYDLYLDVMYREHDNYEGF